jgi:hypothetical protein
VRPEVVAAHGMVEVELTVRAEIFEASRCPRKKSWNLVGSLVCT